MALNTWYAFFAIYDGKTVATYKYKLINGKWVKQKKAPNKGG